MILLRANLPYTFPLRSHEFSRIRWPQLCSDFHVHARTPHPRGDAYRERYEYAPSFEESGTFPSYVILIAHLHNILAVMQRHGSSGPVTIVISPLVSLMEDQVRTGDVN